MGLFDNFPYTNRHELNLDWILSKIKNVEEVAKEAETVKEHSKATHQYYVEAKLGLAEAEKLLADCKDLKETIEKLQEFVADRVSPVKMELLWRNASPSSGFGTSDVRLPAISKEYTMYIIVARYNTGTKHTISSYVFKCNPEGVIYFPACVVGSMKYDECARGYRVQGDGGSQIQFWQAYKNGVVATVSDCIPYEIYGVKYEEVE